MGDGGGGSENTEFLDNSLKYRDMLEDCFLNSLSRWDVDSSNLVAEVAEMADTQPLQTLMNTHELTETLKMMDEDMVAQLIMPS
jgi:hypothetical protein